MSSGTTKGSRRASPGSGEGDDDGGRSRQLRLFDLLRPWVEPARAGAAPRTERPSPSSPAPEKAPSSGRAVRRPRLRTRGRCCDLAEIRDDLNRRFFGGELTAAITWGRRRPRRRPRRRRSGRISMQLGSYHPDQDLVRVHPALDRPWVPRYVLEAVIHHELLHAALPPRMENGRRRLHTPEFRRREREYPHHRKAQEWIRENLRRLISDA